MSPLYGRPFEKVHKNVDRDAQDIAGVATRPTMAFVTTKSEDQLDKQARHPLRERLVRGCTRLNSPGMDHHPDRSGRGRFLDNNFIERLWRSLTQEAVYLEEIQDGFRARHVTGSWMRSYDTERPYSSVENRTPGEAYWPGLGEKLAV